MGHKTNCGLNRLILSSNVIIIHHSLFIRIFSFLLLFPAGNNGTAHWIPNNLPALRFHQVHGDNIQLSDNFTTAYRCEGYRKGITFSNRPVQIKERIFVKFTHISDNWSGAIRFGFTSIDPDAVRNNLPAHAIPDLTTRPGYWMRKLKERYCRRDNVLFFYITSTGRIYFGINGEEKGIFMSEVGTERPLWAVIDVYGNISAVKLLDSRVYMLQSQQQQQQQNTSYDPHIDSILPSLQSLTVNDNLPTQSRTGDVYVPMRFHSVRGRHILLSENELIASRIETEYCLAYAFTARPIRMDEELIVKILQVDPQYEGTLAFGLTSCNPTSIETVDLPEDSYLLLDRPEYWVITKDIAAELRQDDELMFSFDPSGQVKISKNGGPSNVLMHIDQQLQLWAFFDVYGSTQSVRIFTRPRQSSSLNIPALSSTSINSVIIGPGCEPVTRSHNNSPIQSTQSSPVQTESHLTQVQSCRIDNSTSISSNHQHVDNEPQQVSIVVPRYISGRCPLPSHTSNSKQQVKIQVKCL